MQAWSERRSYGRGTWCVLWHCPECGVLQEGRVANNLRAGVSRLVATNWVEDLRNDRTNALCSECFENERKKSNG